MRSLHQLLVDIDDCGFKKKLLISIEELELLNKNGYTNLLNTKCQLKFDTEEGSIHDIKLAPDIKLKEIPKDWIDSVTSQLLGTEVKQSLASEAHDIIYGDREQTYGAPDKNIQCIADFWTAYIKGKEVLTVDDVCNMMNLLKVARSKSNPEHRDNDLDSIGYILLKERIREYRREEK